MTTVETTRMTWQDAAETIVAFAHPDHERDVLDLVGVLLQLYLDRIYADLPKPAMDGDVFAAGEKVGRQRGYALGVRDGEAKARKAVPPKPSVIVVNRNPKTGQPESITEQLSDGTLARRTIERDEGGKVVRIVAATEAT